MTTTTTQALIDRVRALDRLYLAADAARTAWLHGAMSYEGWCACQEAQRAYEALRDSPLPPLPPVAPIPLLPDEEEEEQP